MMDAIEQQTKIGGVLDTRKANRKRIHNKNGLRHSLDECFTNSSDNEFDEINTSNEDNEKQLQFAGSAEKPSKTTTQEDEKTSKKNENMEHIDATASQSMQSVSTDVMISTNAQNKFFYAENVTKIVEDDVNDKNELEHHIREQSSMFDVFERNSRQTSESMNHDAQSNDEYKIKNESKDSRNLEANENDIKGKVFTISDDSDDTDEDDDAVNSLQSSQELEQTVSKSIINERHNEVAEESKTPPVTENHELKFEGIAENKNIHNLLRDEASNQCDMVKELLDEATPVNKVINLDDSNSSMNLLNNNKQTNASASGHTISLNENDYSNSMHSVTENIKKNKDNIIEVHGNSLEMKTELTNQVEKNKNKNKDEVSNQDANDHYCKGKDNLKQEENAKIKIVDTDQDKNFDVNDGSPTSNNVKLKTTKKNNDEFVFFNLKENKLLDTIKDNTDCVVSVTATNEMPKLNGEHKLLLSETEISNDAVISLDGNGNKSKMTTSTPSSSSSPPISKSSTTTPTRNHENIQLNSSYFDEEDDDDDDDNDIDNDNKNKVNVDGVNDSDNSESNLEIAEDIYNSEKADNFDKPTVHTVSEENHETINKPSSPHIERINDESCSSVISTSTTNTTSSHPLVIDQQIDDFDLVGCSTSTTIAPTTTVSEFKSTEQFIVHKKDKIKTEPLSLKIKLKRKLSHASIESDIIPENKKPHLDISIKSNNGYNLGNDSFKMNNMQHAQTTTENNSIINQQTFYNLASSISISPPEVLLQSPQKQQLQQLSQQQVQEQQQMFMQSMLEQQLQKQSLQQRQKKKSSQQKPQPNQTKFACFNCKKDYFTSMRTLKQHQTACLQKSKNLKLTQDILPQPITTTVQPNSSMVIQTPKQNIPVNGVSAQKKNFNNYYKCRSCGTLHEHWNFFIHMQEIHNRYICLNCNQQFQTAEKLSVHLEIKHDLEQNHFNSEEMLRKSVQSYKNEDKKLEEHILMCCTCQHVFLENEPFSDHNCNEYIKPCIICGQTGRHTIDCKAHPDAKRSSKVKKRSKEKDRDEKNVKIDTETMVQITNFPKTQQKQQSSIGSSTTLCDKNLQNQMHEKVYRLLPPTVETTGTSDSYYQENLLGKENEPVLPLDRTTEILVVPKFKLRVPKEFQKSVDAVLSSTESEIDDEESDAQNKAQESSIDIMNRIIPDLITDITMNDNTKANIENPSIDLDDQPGCSKMFYSGLNDDDDDDDSLEKTNTNLARILQEIERTKLDIQRTKNTLNSSKETSELTTIAATVQKKNWSPTPPASPTIATAKQQQQQYQQKDQVEEIWQQQAHENENQLQRRDTIGSEIMDIDETLSSQENTINRSSSQISTVLLQQENTSTEIDIIQSKAAMDITNPEETLVVYNESSKQKVAATGTTTPTSSIGIEAETAPLTTVVEVKESNNITHENDVTIAETSIQSTTPEIRPIPADGIMIADEDTFLIELELDRPIEKITAIEFLRICLKQTYPICLYCNHARRIAVNGKSLALHMIAMHRFNATVDSITAEELQSATIVTKLKSYLSELEEEFFNSNSYCTIGDGAYTHPFNERIFECFSCRFATSSHKELYLHNRKMHLRSAILCFMCRANFYSFSEILCHICPGEPNKTSIFDVKYRCCLCNLDKIPSPFRLMVHLRRSHFACDVCLEDCRDQSKLSSHVWKHKLHHLCYRCGIAYRNKQDITKHLFWKHGTESIICKRCLQKRWRHVYHFCIPPSNFICDMCHLCFSKAMYLNVHKRMHLGDLRYPCTEENCEDKFVSRRLLLKHTVIHEMKDLATDENKLEASTAEDKLEENEIEVSIEKTIELKDVKKQNDADITITITDEEGIIKVENDEKENFETITKNEDVNSETTKSKLDDKKEESRERDREAEKKKHKKHKRSKVMLEDLNLIAPNLSESDSSSDDSDTEQKTKNTVNSILVPNVMLSPPSEIDEYENDEGAKNKNRHQIKQSVNENFNKAAVIEENPEKVLQIWKNFLQSQGSIETDTEIKQKDETTDYTEDNYPNPVILHVIISDHDYCKMYYPPAEKTKKKIISSLSNNSLLKQKTATISNSSASSSPVKQQKINKNIKDSDDSSSSSGSDSSSDSSCSCGSNCSCTSSSGDDSSSSSSSSGKSDSSGASSTHRRKRHRKKSERRKAESLSPVKKVNKSSLSETINVEEVDSQQELLRPPSPPKEPVIYESDLETAESETDEEFYDKHPQKLANEILAQKRAQLMARTFLSPSHNYDIVENSRPSTPSLPEDVSFGKKMKQKKKKRERKSNKLHTSISSVTIHNNVEAPALAAGDHVTGSQQAPINFIPMIPTTISNLPQLSEVEIQTLQNVSSISNIPVNQMQHVPHQQQQHLTHQQLHQHMVPNVVGRMSEGSSCSDADASLKRSKRMRRPNKFYGYTSDDENMASVLAPPLIIGTRAFKPQPPPQLTWHKEDLPTPSKSIMNSKPKLQRTPKTPVVSGLSLFNSDSAKNSLSAKRKRPLNDKSARKRSMKHSLFHKKLPPIPPLKIRPSQIGIGQHQIPNQLVNRSIPGRTTSYYSSDAKHDESSDSSSDDEFRQQLSTATTVTGITQVKSGSEDVWNTTSHLSSVALFQATKASLPTEPPRPPQAKVFNTQIPPALLPNPDIHTLNYFRANNIRYPIRPPVGARKAREGEAVYCYCRCPYDEVSEMIACDGVACLIEWFHFECVGIMVAPQGKWFCAECRPIYSTDLYGPKDISLDSEQINESSGGTAIG